MDVPQKMEYTITNYRMLKEDIYGYVDATPRYDLLEVVMVCLGREGMVSKGAKLHGLLSTLLSDSLKPDEKKRILTQEYDIATSVELEGGFQSMCNLSEAIEEKGIKEGALLTLASLVKDNVLGIEEAAKRAGISVNEFEKFLQSRV